MENKHRSLFLLAAGALILLLLQPFFTWFTADDFCLIGKVQADGIISNMFHEYLTWDGRSISLTYPVCRLGLWLGKYWVGPMLGSLLLLILGVFMLRGLGFKNNHKAMQLVQSISLAAALWLAFFNFSSQTLYWTTGVGYVLDLVMLMSALWLYRIWQPTLTHYLLAIPVYFYAGTCSPNGVLALLVVLGIEQLYRLMVLRETNWKRFGYALLWILPALLLVIFSPGNARRMTGMNSQNLTHIWTIYFNLKWMFTNLWKYNTLVVWGMLVLGILGGIKQILQSSTEGLVRKLILVFYQHRYLLGAGIAFLFFMANPGLHAPRTNIQFVFFVFLYGLVGGRQLLDVENTLYPKMLLQLQWLVLLVFCGLAGTQLFDARIVKGQLAQRDAKLRGLRGTDVVLTEADFVRPPYTRRFEDLATDSSYWLNRCVADHYGLKSIKMVDTRKKTVHFGQMAE